MRETDYQSVLGRTGAFPIGNVQHVKMYNIFCKDEAIGAKALEVIEELKGI